jgi:hypothetical protein
VLPEWERARCVEGVEAPYTLDADTLGTLEDVNAYVLFVATERAVGAAVAPMPREGAVFAQVLLVDAPVMVSGTMEDVSGGDIAGAVVRPCAQAMAMTALNGQFATRCPGGSAVLRASAAHYADLGFTTHYGATDATFKLRMQPEGVIFGRVVHGEGVPPEAVVGLDVELHSAEMRFSGLSPDVDSTLEPRRKSTGEDGKFTFDRLARGPYRVEVADERYVAVADRELRAAEGASTGPILVTLHRACRTEITVSVGGERCEEGRVTPGYPTVLGAAMGSWALAYEISEGTSVISWGEASTSLTIECTNPPSSGVVSRRAEPRGVAVCPSSWAIDMPGAARVDVCVEEEGVPIVGAEFTFGLTNLPAELPLKDGSTFIADIAAPTLTGDDGCAPVLLSAGRWFFRSPGAEIQTFDVAEGVESGRVVLRRQRAASLSFDVQQGGQPAKGATIRLSDVTAGLAFSTAGSDEDGRVDTSAPPGRYDLRVTLNGRRYGPEPRSLVLEAGERRVQRLDLAAADETTATVCVVSEGEPWPSAEVVVMDLRGGYRFDPDDADKNGILDVSVDAEGCAEVPKIPGSVVFARDALHDTFTNEIRLAGPGPFQLEMPRKKSVKLVFDEPAPGPLVLEVFVESRVRRVRMPLAATTFLIEVPLIGDVQLTGCSSASHCVDAVFSAASTDEVRVSWRPAPIIRGTVPVDEDPWVAIRWNHMGFHTESKVAADGSFSIQVPPRTSAAPIISAGGATAFVKLAADARPGEVRDIGLTRIPGFKAYNTALPTEPP